VPAELMSANQSGKSSWLTRPPLPDFIEAAISCGLDSPSFMNVHPRILSSGKNDCDARVAV